MIRPTQEAPRVIRKSPDPELFNRFSFDAMRNWVNARFGFVKDPERSVGLQADYARRMAENDQIHIGGEVWIIKRIIKGADTDIQIENTKSRRIESVASLELVRMEHPDELPPKPPVIVIPPPLPPGETEVPPPIPPTGRTPVAGGTTRRQPTGPVKDVTLDFGVADISDSFGENVSDAEAERTHVEKGEAGFWKKVFKHNIFREKYRQGGLNELCQEALNEEDAFAGRVSERGSIAKATGAVIDRLLDERKEFLHSEGEHGERRRYFGETEEELVVKRELEALVREYAANPEMDKAELKERKSAIFAKMNRLAGEAKGRGKMFADNLDRLVENVRQQASAAGGIENLNIDLKIVVGKMLLGARTEREKGMIDQALEKLERWGVDNNHIGGTLAIFRNPLAVALGTAAGALALGARMGLSNIVTKAFSFGASAVLSGVYAGWQEKGRQNEERALDARQRAVGKKSRNDETPEERVQREIQLQRKLAETPWYQPWDRKNIKKELEDIKNNVAVQPRRAEMEQFLINTRTSKELIEVATSYLDANGVDKLGNPKYELKEFVPIFEATDILADIDARVRLSDSLRRDFITYSGIAEAELERKELDNIRCYLKAGLRARYDNDNRTISDQEIDKTQFKTFQEYFDAFYKLRADDLYGKDSKARNQDALFAKHAGGKAMEVGVTTAVVGGTVGLAFHEITALITGSDTVIGSAARWLADYFNHPPTIPVGPTHVEMIAGAAFTVPGGTSLTLQPNGSISWIDDATHRVLAGGMHLDSAGHLDAASLAKMSAVGGNVVVLDLSNTVHSTTTTTEGVTDWLNSHKSVVTEVDRLHIGNNTPMPDVDFNEKLFHLGGIHGTGLDAHGNGILTFAHMTPGGSFHGAIDINPAADLAAGKIRVLITLNDAHGAHSVVVMPEPNGDIIIPKGSDLFDTAFKVANGKLVPIARYIEVAVADGHTTSGVPHFNILATIEGNGITDGVTSTALDHVIVQPASHISGSSAQVPVALHSPDVAIPLVPIEVLEPMKRGKKGTSGPGYGYGYEGRDYGLLAREKYRERLVGGLKNNPEYNTAEHENELISEYLSLQAPEYIADLESIAGESENMKKTVDIVITLPAYGEGKNIEATIRNYAKMKDRERFEIVIFENHPRSKNRDNTSGVVARMKNEFPDLNIILLYKEFDEKEPIGRIRKYLVDSVLLRKQKAGIRHSISIVSNDADLEDISPNYARDVGDAFANNTELDALAARWDFPEETYKKFPLLHASQRLWHYLDITMRHNFMKSPELIGRNSAFRAGTYAAIGGYNETSQLAEDLEIGWMIKEARHYDSDRITYSNKARLVSNPRRAVVKMLSGGRLVQQYGDFHVNEDVRSAPLDSLLDVKRDFDVAEFSSEVQAIYNHYSAWAKSKGGWVPDDVIEKSFSRAMRFLGVKYTIDSSGTVKLTDTTKLTNGLNMYNIQE